jgi:hypothetical protein
MPFDRSTVPEVIYLGRRYDDNTPSSTRRLPPLRADSEVRVQAPRRLDVGRARPIRVTAISAREIPRRCTPLMYQLGLPAIRWIRL